MRKSLKGQTMITYSITNEQLSELTFGEGGYGDFYAKVMIPCLLFQWKKQFSIFRLCLMK